jgi:hypothetical protein
MGKEVSQGEDPRFLLYLTRGRNECPCGTEADRNGVYESLCP